MTMGMTAVEPTVSASPAAATDSRALLWSGGPVEMAIPADADEGSVLLADGSINYLHFAKGVKGGGVINFFLHAPVPSDWRGMRVVARAKIICKTFPDGRAFLHVDLEPVDGHLEPTQRIAVLPLPAIAPQEDVLVFETPAPLRGALVVAPADFKFPGSMRDAPTLASKKQPTSASSGSNDPQLDRLLSQGWTIAADHGSEVLLSKEKNGKPVAMTHHRPRSSDKRR